jgi:hypothetical protein
VFRASQKTWRSSRGRASRATCSGDADTRQGRARRGRQRRRRLRREGLVAPGVATARVPGPSSPALLPARALLRPLADKRVYRPRHFHVPLRFAPRGHPSRLRASLRSAFNRTEGSVKPPEACGARPARARAVKGLARRANEERVRLRAQACSVHAPHACAARKATRLAAAAFGRGGKALAVRMRRFRSVVCAWSLARRARPPRGHAPASAGPGAARAVPARGIEDTHEGEPQMPRAEAKHGT